MTVDSSSKPLWRVRNIGHEMLQQPAGVCVCYTSIYLPKEETDALLTLETRSLSYFRWLSTLMPVQTGSSFHQT